MNQKKLVILIEGSLMEFLSAIDSSTESKRNLFVLVEPSLLHHTFLLGPARFTALPISALAPWQHRGLRACWGIMGNQGKRKQDGGHV